MYQTIVPTCANVMLSCAPCALQEEPHKPWRGRGTANPGHGLSQEMVQTLAFNPEAPAPPQQLLSNNKKLVWSVAPKARSAASVLRHRMSDPASEPKAAKVCALHRACLLLC
jgi:hypothetical protein